MMANTELKYLSLLLFQYRLLKTYLKQRMALAKKFLNEEL